MNHFPIFERIVDMSIHSVWTADQEQCLLAYIFLAKALEYYEKRPEDKDGENGDWRTVEEQYVAVPLV